MEGKNYRQGAAEPRRQAETSSCAQRIARFAKVISARAPARAEMRSCGALALRRLGGSSASYFFSGAGAGAFCGSGAFGGASGALGFCSIGGVGPGGGAGGGVAALSVSFDTS